MNYIEHIVEPQRLLLTWQNESDGNTRRIVAELHREGNGAGLKYLTETPDFEKALNLQFKGYPGFSIEQASYKDVLGFFIKRLPQKSREDFQQFLEACRISGKDRDKVSDFALLGYSGAKIPGDPFMVLNPFDNANDVPFEIFTKVEGTRYMNSSLSGLTEGMPVSIQPEPQNSFDPKAIQIMVEGKTIGYINRVLLQCIHKNLSLGRIKETFIEKINGSAESPNYYVFIRISL